MVSSEITRISFGTQIFFFFFVKKFTFRGGSGGAGQRQFEKSLHFDFFVLGGPLPNAMKRLSQNTNFLDKGEGKGGLGVQTIHDMFFFTCEMSFTINYY